MELDYEELIATRKLNGVGDKLFKRQVMSMKERQDLIDQTNEEIAVLEEYLPKQLTDEELENEVKKIVESVGATSVKDMGKVMKEAKVVIGAKADGKRINEMVKKILA